MPAHPGWVKVRGAETLAFEVGNFSARRCIADDFDLRLMQPSRSGEVPCLIEESLLLPENHDSVSLDYSVAVQFLIAPPLPCSAISLDRPLYGALMPVMRPTARRTSQCRRGRTILITRWSVALGFKGAATVPSSGPDEVEPGARRGAGSVF